MTLRIYSQLCEIGCGAFSFCALFSGAGDAIPLCWVFKSVSSTADVTPWLPTFHWPGIKLGGSFCAGRRRVRGSRRAQGDGVSLAGTLQSYAGFTQLSGDGWILQQCPSLPDKTLDAGGRPWNEPSHLLEFCKCSRYWVSPMPATTGETQESCMAQELPSAWQVLPSRWQSAKTRIQVQALLDILGTIYQKYCSFSVSEGKLFCGCFNYNIYIIHLKHPKKCLMF